MIMEVRAVGADLSGWATVHGVRLPGGDMLPVWRLVVTSTEVAERVARLLGGTVEPDGSHGWAVITHASTLNVWITRASASALGFRLMGAPGLGVIGLDLGPWSLADVFGTTAAELVARWSIGDMVARVVIVKDRGGGFVRHLAPALHGLAPV